MCHYFANFQKTENHVFRFDTRIYLEPVETTTPNDKCIAAVIAKNPGSASALSDIYDELAPLKLGNDKTLPAIKNRFVGAYQLALKKPPIGGYVLVWNLFYLCKKDLSSAIKIFQSIPRPPHLCDTEMEQKPDIIWYAWGSSDNFLNTLKIRFSHTPAIGFFYDNKNTAVQLRTPRVIDPAMHPSVAPGTPVEKFLAPHL